MTAKINSQSRVSQIHDITNQQIKGVNTNDILNPEQLTLIQSSSKMYIIIGVAVFVIASGIILGVTLGLLLKRSQPGVQPAPEPEPQPAPRNYSCLDFPTECIGVLQAVQNQTFNTYHDPNQIRAQLQIGRSFSAIQDNSRQNLSDTYQQLFRSVQCLAYNMPDTFSQAYSDIARLQFQTEQPITNYLNMTYSFSGQPLALTPSAQVATTCQFPLTPSRRLRRRYLQSSCPARNATAILPYFDGNAFSPIMSFKYLTKVNEFISQNSSVSFDGGAALFGSYRKDEFTTFFLDLITQYEQDLQSRSQPIPSRASLLWCLRVFVDLDYLVATFPGDITGELMGNFFDFYNLKITLSINNMGVTYDVDSGHQFVSKQIMEGKKVVVLAHAEGAIYTNYIYNFLTESQKLSVGLVYTAPYSNNMAGGLTNYITNPSDYLLMSLIYRASTLSIPAPMAANAADKIFNRAIDIGNNHDFRGYLQQYKTQLTQLVASAKNRLTQPSVNAPLITVSLTWDTVSDLDLHVNEPNSGHVYWAYPDGLGKHEGYKPEHYKLGCQNIIAGDYTVGVNYYSASYGPGGATTLTVTVTAGTVNYSRTMVLSTVRGSAGNNSPTYVCKITATFNPATSAYTFQVVE